MTMLSHWISILVQFALHASDPSWSCTLTHRDPGLPGTYYLYCTQTAPNGVEIISVGKYISDGKSATKVAP
jgi:hypothetical protein